MRIIWNTNVNAPGCIGEILADNGDSVLIQTDYDWPGVARSFGWDMRDCQNETAEDSDDEAEPCEHSGTDGTIDCPVCGYRAGWFICAAGEWLRANDGAEAEDPGYFN